MFIFCRRLDVQFLVVAVNVLSLESVIYAIVTPVITAGYLTVSASQLFFYLHIISYLSNTYLILNKNVDVIKIFQLFLFTETKVYVTN